MGTHIETLLGARSYSTLKMDLQNSGKRASLAVFDPWIQNNEKDGNLEEP